MDSNPKSLTSSAPEPGLMLDELVNGASKVLENASALYDEAFLLHSAGALSRALFLHQISLEECAKVDMLGTWAVSAQLGMEADVRKLTRAFASHKAKNYTNAYLLPAAKAERDAKREKRWSDAIEAFKAQQAEFHLESNSAKNGSLYVDFHSGAFSAPKDRVDEAMVSKIANANGEYLGAARSKVEMMRRWRDNPDQVRDFMKWFQSRLNEVMAASDDPEQALGALMDEMMARATETGYAEAMRRKGKDTAAT